MSHEILKFTSKDAKEDGVKGWHLTAKTGDGEFSACGLAFDCYKEHIKEIVEKGGITCENCLEAIKFYKSIKL